MATLLEMDALVVLGVDVEDAEGVVVVVVIAVVVVVLGDGGGAGGGGT
jgi:hypothetical protein